MEIEGIEGNRVIDAILVVIERNTTIDIIVSTVVIAILVIVIVMVGSIGHE